MPIVRTLKFVCSQCGHAEDIPDGELAVTPQPFVAAPVAPPTKPKQKPPEPPPQLYTWTDGGNRSCPECGGVQSRCYIPVRGKNTGTTLEWGCTNPQCLLHPLNQLGVPSEHPDAVEVTA